MLNMRDAGTFSYHQTSPHAFLHMKVYPRKTVLAAGTVAFISICVPTCVWKKFESHCGPLALLALSRAQNLPAMPILAATR